MGEGFGIPGGGEMKLFFPICFLAIVAYVFVLPHCLDGQNVVAKIVASAVSK